MSSRHPRSPRVRPRLVFKARPALSSLLILIAATCRDAPTEPQLEPGGGLAYAVTGLTITPLRDTILIGQVFALSVKNSNGSAITKTAAWTSSDTTVAKVVSTGLATANVTGRTAGTVTITATSQSKGGTNTTTVIPVPVRSVTITPDSVSLQRGDSAQYTATPKDSAGNALTGRVVTWSVVDTSIAKVNSTGKVVTYARGTTQVRATSEGKVGTAKINVRVPQLTVSAISTIDSANVGDTLVVAYSVQNLWDTPNPDSVLVRVGLRSAGGSVATAVRRALVRVDGGATRIDTARFTVGQTVLSGNYTVVAFADCKDAAPATNEARLTDCLAAPASAGTIAEGNETDNSRSANVFVRGPELTIATLAAPDSLFTRTSITATATINNSGSSTGMAFDVVAGVYDATSSVYVAATAATTTSLGSRQSRAVALGIAIPAGTDPGHSYEVRAFADCRNGGGTPLARLQACITAPATAGDVPELSETNNSASRSAVVASNIARVVAIPDSVLLTAIGDTTSLGTAAYDRANALVSGVTFSVTSLDASIVSATAGQLRSLATGVARIVVIAEGRADTSRVYVVQQIASVLASPDTAAVSALGDTAPFTAVVYDRNSNLIPGATIAWTSLDPVVASVSGSGTATALATGVARIVATSGTRSDTSRLIVAQQIARVTVTPDSAVLTALGDTARFTATAFDNNGNVAAATFTWTSLDPAIATVATTGTATAVSNGVARIVATSSGHTDTSRVIVMQQVARVSSSPETVALGALGETAQLSATITDSRSNAVVGATATWTSLDPGVASVSGAGLVTALSVGSARVVAANAGVADTTSVTVQQLAARVVASPDSALMTAPGDTTRLSAIAYDANGNAVPSAAIVWTSLDPEVATVASTGTVTAVVTGIARIVGAFNGHADTSRVYITWETARVAIAPDTMRLTSLGDTARFGATAYDHHDNPIPGAFITWASLDPGIASIDEHGKATAVAVGTARVTGMVSGHAPDTAVVVVQQIAARVGATPDSVVLTALGASALFNASAYDANGNAIVGAALSWTSLDPAIASTSGNSVTAQGTGRARVVVAAGGVADTVYAIVEQQIASVTLSADTVSLQIGATLQFTAVVRDGSGSVMSGQSVSFASLDGAVASVTGAGLVAATTDGTARIVASAGSVADTALLLVNPAGYTSRWVGSMSNEWHQAFNWYPRQVPDSTTSVYLASGAPYYPLVNSNGSGVSVARLKLAPATSISGDMLRFYADLPDIGQGSYAIQLTSIAGSMTLAHSHVLPGAVFVDNGAQLTLAGHTLDVGSFGTSFGTLTMNASTDTLIAREYANFNGLANLSAGVLRVQGGMNINTNGPVPGAGWNVSGTHKVLFAGTLPQSFTDYDTTHTHFQNVEIWNPQGVTLTGVTNVGGLLKLAAGGRLTGDYNTRVKLLSQLPDVSQGTYDVYLTVVAGQITATRNVALPQSLFIDNGGQLRLAGHTIDVNTIATYYGTLTMDNAADTLIVRQYASFYGLENLSAGAMVVNGDFQASTPPNVPGAAWNASGSHTTVFAGSNPQNIQFQDTTIANLNHVLVRNTQGVTLTTTTTVRGLLRLVAGGRLATGNMASIKYTTQMPDIGDGIYEPYLSLVAGPIDMNRNVTFPASVAVDAGGQLRLNGHTLDASTVATYYGALTMDSPADTLVARQYVSFYGLENLSAGTMIVRGDMQVGTVPSVPGSAWNLSGTHKIAFAGTMPQALFFSDTTVANLRDVEVSNPQGLTINGSTNIRGQLRLVNGGRLVAGNYGTLKYFSRMPDIAQGVYEAQISLVAGPVVATSNQVYPGSVFVANGGNLTLNGHTLDINYFGTQDGTLTMNNAADTLIARQGAQLYGAANLSAGALILYGDMTISSFAGMPSAFAGSGSHTTVFAGTQPQNLQLPSDGLSYFGNLQIDNAAGVQFGDSLDVRGQLMGSGSGVLRSQYGARAVKVGGGLNVAGLVLDGVWLDVTGALTRFDNVTFQNVGAPALLRVRSTAAQSLTMNNVSFLMPPNEYSKWIDADGPLALDVVSSQYADGPASTRVASGAIVTWRAPAMGGGNNNP